MSLSGTANTTFRCSGPTSGAMVPFNRNDVSSGNGICEFSISRRIMSGLPESFLCESVEYHGTGESCERSGVFGA